MRPRRPITRAVERLGVVGFLCLVAMACAACGGAGSGSSDQVLPASLVKQIKAAVRENAVIVGASSAKTADVYGPAPYAVVEKASARGGASDGPHVSGAWYLIVLHGHFSCNCPMPPGAKGAPSGKIALETWSPSAKSRRQGGTGYSVAKQLPAAVSRLSGPTTVDLG